VSDASCLQVSGGGGFDAFLNVWRYSLEEVFNQLQGFIMNRESISGNDYMCHYSVLMVYYPLSIVNVYI
jgi:hypothetical protein